MNAKVTKKKASKKKSSKPKLCLRQVDQSTQVMSDDVSLPEAVKSPQEKLPKGHTRVDASTIVKA